MPEGMAKRKRNSSKYGLRDGPAAGSTSTTKADEHAVWWWWCRVSGGGGGADKKSPVVHWRVEWDFSSDASLPVKLWENGWDEARPIVEAIERHLEAREVGRQEGREGAGDRQQARRSRRAGSEEMREVAVAEGARPCMGGCGCPP